MDQTKSAAAPRGSRDSTTWLVPGVDAKCPLGGDRSGSTGDVAALCLCRNSITVISAWRAKILRAPNEAAKRFGFGMSRAACWTGAEQLWVRGLDEPFWCWHFFCSAVMAARCVFFLSFLLPLCFFLSLRAEVRRLAHTELAPFNESPQCLQREITSI